MNFDHQPAWLICFIAPSRFHRSCGRWILIGWMLLKVSIKVSGPRASLMGGKIVVGRQTCQDVQCPQLWKHSSCAAVEAEQQRTEPRFGLLQGPGQDAPLPVGAHVMSDSRDVCCACRRPGTTEDPLIRCTAPRCMCTCHYGCGNVYPEQHTVKWFCSHCDENGYDGWGLNDWEPDYSPNTGPPYPAIFDFPNHPRLEDREGATSRMPSSEIDCSTSSTASQHAGSTATPVCVCNGRTAHA